MVLNVFQRMGCCICKNQPSPHQLKEDSADTVVVQENLANNITANGKIPNGINPNKKFANGNILNGNISNANTLERRILSEKTFGAKSLSGSLCPSAAVSFDQIYDDALPAYKVIVRTEKQEWFVFRRYAEFEILCDIITKQVPDHGLTLPEKTSLDGETIQLGLESLDSFIQKLMANPSLVQIAEVRDFLQLDRWAASKEDLSDSHSSESTCSCNSSNHNSNMSSTGKHDCEHKTNMVNLGPTEKKHVKPSEFEFLKIIGKGSFGKVLLAKHRAENKYFAVKVLSKKQVIKRNEAKHIMSERNVLLKNLDHPFLVGLQYSFQTPTKLYFVLDYVNGGELFFHLQRERCFKEPRARFYAAEIVAALSYLHAQGIIYRDLKPENLLLDSQGHIVLTDFGLSKEGLYYNQQTHTFCGTPEYLAPEVLRKESYDFTVDWWCLGCVLFEMLYGLPPFYSKHLPEMYERILNKPPKLKPTASEDARDILTKLLHKDKRSRLGAGISGDGEIKQHIFFRPIDWGELLARRIEPPFNPNVTDALDLHNIDPEFTQAAVPQSLGQSHQSNLLVASVQQADDIFAGFSYAPPMTML